MRRAGGENRGGSGGNVQSGLLWICSAIIWVLYCIPCSSQTYFSNYAGRQVSGLTAVANKEGGFAVAGMSFERSFELPDGFLASFDSSGKLIWKILIGGSWSDKFTSVIQMPDGSYIAAGESKTLLPENYDRIDLLLVKIDRNGRFVWQKIFVGNYFKPLLVATRDNGFLLLSECSTFADPDPLKNTASDYLLIKADSTGKTQWIEILPLRGINELLAAFQAKDGSFVIAGTGDDGASITKIGETGKLAWATAFTGLYQIQAIEQASDGNILAAAIRLDSTQQFLFKITPKGTILWSKGYGVPNESIDIVAMRPLVNGESVIVGTLNEETFLAKIDSLGKIKWKTVFDVGIFNDWPAALIELNEGSLVVVGESANSRSQIATSMFKLSTSGKMQRCYFRSVPVSVSDVALFAVPQNVTVTRLASVPRTSRQLFINRNFAFPIETICP